METRSWTGNCHQCGKPVARPVPSRVRAGKGLFCSRACAMRSRETRHGHNPRHGGQSPTYRSWAHMIQRCRNPNNSNYRHYGEAGIVVCDEWLSFENFLRDMGERPEGTTLDRKDVYDGYCPANCQWGTRGDQARNKKQTVWVEYRGERICVRDLAKRFDMSEATLHGRIARGWPEDRWNAPSQVWPNHVSRRYPGRLPLRSEGQSHSTPSEAHKQRSRQPPSR